MSTKYLDDKDLIKGREPRLIPFIPPKFIHSCQVLECTIDGKSIDVTLYYDGKENYLYHISLPIGNLLLSLQEMNVIAEAVSSKFVKSWILTNLIKKYTENREEDKLFDLVNKEII